MDIASLSAEELHRLYELYMEEMRRHRKSPNLKDFVLWVGER